MANIKSQIKRNRQNEKRRVRNRTFRGAARTAVTNARAAFTQNDEPTTRAAVMKAISMLDKAAQKGVVHPNNAARRKGRLMKKLAAFKPSETPVVEKKAKKAPTKKAAPKKAAAKKSE